MTATVTLDKDGRITLPDALKRAFGIQPGMPLRAEASEGRLEIVKDVPEVSEGVMEDGLLVLPRLGIKVDVAAAVRAERDALAERALRR